MDTIGRYNPHRPQILGLEWVPIRQETLALSPAANFAEIGHKFKLQTQRTVESAKFYIEDFPPSLAAGQVFQINLYPDSPDLSAGPIERVVIPCTSVTATGGVALSPGATTFTQALFDPSDDLYVQFDSTAANTGLISIFFPTNNYNTMLNGKRILAANFLHTLSASLTTDITEPGTGNNPLNMVLRRSLSGIGFNTQGYKSLVPTGISPATPASQPIQRRYLGEVNQMFDNPPGTSTRRRSWTYDELLRFRPDLAISNRLEIRISDTASFAPDLATTHYMGYAALEVFFCEETRLDFMGAALGSSVVGNRTQDYLFNTNKVLWTALPILDPGAYIVTLSSPSVGDALAPVTTFFPDIPVIAETAYPPLNALRQLYALPDHPGVRINIPFPVEDHVGDIITQEEVNVLPQLSLHLDSGSDLNEVFAYGRQARAQVYDIITATQDISDDIPGSPSGSYEQVRWYSRRFGNTTVPLKLDSITPAVSGAGTFVTITPEEFDELPEIIDGWKEVTRTFPTAPIMGNLSGSPRWRWSAVGELKQDRWEVLGAIAPALSGVPGNLLNLVPPIQRLTGSTYEPGFEPTFSSATEQAEWMPGFAPPVSGTTGDPSTDLVLIFSDNPPAVSGFSVETLNQAVSGIGQDCGLPPCCIPTQIKYNRLTWNYPSGAGYSLDGFNRIVAANSWGTADSGQAWSVNTTGTTWSVSDGQGQVSMTTNSVNRTAHIETGGQEQDIQVDFFFDDPWPAARTSMGVIGRVTNDSNYYYALLERSSAGVMSLIIGVTVANVRTDLISALVPDLGPAISAERHIRFQITGGLLRAKVWAETQTEPEWQTWVADSTYTTQTRAGVYVRVDTAPVGTWDWRFDNFSVSPPDFTFGYKEIQRSDTVETDWQTIMKATNPGVTGFNDYEARVGILSNYRIREVNLYEFAGPWTSGASATIPAPGVTIGCDDGHLLIFTSNEVQDGSINLAYSSVWESGEVQEEFGFPEANFVQLQAMYNRDFFTAFRPTERGGEQFERTMLVQAAAIAPETLADFTSLRDMAWADTSYICVRDEDGNRWLATVLVPGGRVLRDRRLYMAPVNIVEVTDIPSPADPS